MAKSIQLVPGLAPPAAATPTSSRPAAPQPTRMVGPPLPAGQVFTAPGSMTELERAKLTAVGWSAGKPITPAMQAAIAAAAAEAATPLTPPVDPLTPPVSLNVKDINSMSTADQTRYRTATESAQPAAQSPSLLREMQDTPVQQMPPVAEKVFAAKTVNVDYGMPDRPAPDFVTGQEHAATVPAETPREPIAPLGNCPHCGWDLTMPDIPEPEYEEKIGFLSTNMLGDGKPYVKTYRLLDGKLELTFRGLTIMEADACYAQADKDKRAGRVEGQLEWYEKLNRYRLYLQLQRVKSAYADHELPEGLSAKTSPNAGSFWQFPEGEPEPLRLIEDYVLSMILSSESLCRVAQQTCAAFQRLTAKLEAQVPNDAFWKATAEQS